MLPVQRASRRSLAFALLPFGGLPGRSVVCWTIIVDARRTLVLARASSIRPSSRKFKERLPFFLGCRF
jgi:hypothetical protein